MLLLTSLCMHRGHAFIFDPKSPFFLSSILGGRRRRIRRKIKGKEKVIKYKRYPSEEITGKDK